jgi:DNA modification methylase
MKNGKKPEYTWVPLKSVKPWHRNPRKNDAAVKCVALSIQELGFNRPLIVSRKNAPWPQRTICCGHTAYKAAESLGLEEVPVLLMSMTEEQFVRYNAADNKTSELAEWDFTELGELMKDFEVTSIPGFSQDEFNTLLRGLDTPGEVVEDPVPEVGEACVVESGDLWVCGEHRVLCGDAREAESYERLGVNKESICLTDPPYAVGYSVSFSKAEGGAAVGNQSAYHEAKNAGDILTGFLSAMPCSVVIMTYPVDRHLFELASALRAAKFDSVRELVWVKDRATFHPGATFQQQHEPILLCRRNGAVLPDIQETTVLEISNPRQHSDHPTEKPQSLWSRLMKWYSGAVLDPFLGSGTTMIAAEQLNRRCYGIEIEPRYVQVSLQRWRNLTSKEPIRERDGKTLRELEEAKA